MHWVGQIEGRYKDGASDQPFVLEQQQPVKQEHPAQEPKRQRHSHTLLSVPSDNGSIAGLLCGNIGSEQDQSIGPTAAHHHHPRDLRPAISGNKISSFSIRSSSISFIPPATKTATKTPTGNITHSITATATEQSFKRATYHQPTTTTTTTTTTTASSSISISQKRSLHQRQSQGLPLVRRSLVNELRPWKSMEECHQPRHLRSEPILSASDLDNMICSSSNPPQNDLSHLVTTATSEVPRYCSEAAVHHHHHHQFISDSISSESLHAQYSYNAGVVSRSHSMSSLHSTPIHESSEESDDQQQYTVRRTSEAADPMFVGHQSQHPSFSHPTPAEEYTHQNAWAAQQAFTPEHSIAEESPVDAAAAAATVSHWWETASTSAEEHKTRVEEWTPQDPAHITLSSRYPAPHTPASFDRGVSAEPYIGSQAAMMYSRHPPSPAEDYGVAVHLKALPAAPSPPESPGYQFGFSPQQAWSGYPQYQRRTSIPLTPPSRPPSATNTNTTVLAAATAALAASKSQRNKTQSTRHASRRKASNSSMRSSSKQQQQQHSDSGEMSFVNFTPNDATRILSGVAPSGSSKTKARREREALEKRRKLSEAAAAAVLAVGGDASALAKVNLL